MYSEAAEAAGCDAQACYMGGMVDTCMCTIHGLLLLRSTCAIATALWMYGQVVRCMQLTAALRRAQEWPESVVPWTPIGKMVLNENIKNFHNEVVKIAFVCCVLLTRHCCHACCQCPCAKLDVTFCIVDQKLTWVLTTFLPPGLCRQRRLHSTRGCSRRALRPATTRFCRRASWHTRTRSATAWGCVPYLEAAVGFIRRNAVK